MTKKIFRSIMLVATAVLVSCFVIILGVLYEYFSAIQTNRLKSELELAVTAAESSGTEYLKNIKNGDIRVTLIDKSGNVLFDTKSDSETMDNHSNREEFKEAKETGYGDSKRYSKTLTEETRYVAQRLSNGNVLRVSAGSASVLSLVLSMLQPLLIVLALALILAAVIAKRAAGRIVEPLNNIDFEKPLENNTYNELSPLLTHIESQRRQIRATNQKLQNRKDEFYAVIKNMNEGLVLLNKDRVILSINPSAEEFFDAYSAKGRDFIEIERSTEINKVIEKAEQDGRAETEIKRNGRVYRFNVSSIKDDGSADGVVILIFDITDEMLAEQNRREFTANVSHELKTPLHSIMGSAELLENNMVKPEDKPRFIGHIRSESERLVSLIDDIIRLSQLDEGGETETEEIDVKKTVQSETEILRNLAERENVSLSVEGETFKINGVPSYLREIVHNLCENAIKYNVDGGRVTVTLSKTDKSITVSDTGIGIPKSQQQRIFERFYRVDKSRSKETGGTGLGLSIVKHAVERLGGKITLKSEENKGTEITVTF